MDKHCSTTPSGVFQTPDTSFALSNLAMKALAAFDACLVQMQRLQQAEARLDPSGYNTAVFGCEAEVADAHALADKLLMAFYRSDNADLWELTNAAWVMLLLLQSNGQDLYLIAQRSAGLRRTAAACARSPLPLEIVSVKRLFATAEVLDLMIEAALDDYAAIDPDNVDDLRGLVGRGLAAAIDQARVRQLSNDPDPAAEPDFGPC